MTDRVDTVFSALADPTRRRVLDEIGRRGAATATELAADLPVTRQAVAKHLGILADAGLVDARRTGRETRYRVTPEPLGDAIGWMARVGAEWDERLARLQAFTTSRR
ncbi:MAG TPA: metalloregulator ArsR/SmtB family transcription factor [Capillimicrobium sp.]|nr:metalloregulator ArsR/SmtB family transcription factor [Capillimicrobium sp.]